MRKYSLALGLLGALVVGRSAFATGIATHCPKTFTCAFTAAEVHALTDATTPRAPAVFVGYLVFDSTGLAPTLISLGNDNGTIGTLSTVVGTCTWEPAASRVRWTS